MNIGPRPPETPLQAEEAPPPSPSAERTSPTPSHGGRFVRYNISGNVFEVTAKYKPPISLIGKGAYGVVCSALNSEKNMKVAIKKITNAFARKIDAIRTLREIKILRHMNHDNVSGIISMRKYVAFGMCTIVEIKDIIPPPQRGTFSDVYIVFELMDIDLRQIIHSRRDLSEHHRQFFLYQILRGLKYIHSANVVHRDMKPSNLIVNMNCNLKICDFGLAIAASETVLMTEYVVTRWYRAPELLLHSDDYTTAIDVWSVGCIFMEMANGTPLFPGRDEMHQLSLLLELLGTPSEADLESLHENGKKYIRQLRPYKRQSLGEVFPHVTPLALDLVEKMLAFNPRRRITVEDALAHPYMESLHDINDEPICSNPFNDDFEQKELSDEQIKEMIYQESLAYNPEHTNKP
ncbi:hypothetical protein F511_20220 [Dorcoceras hygrometricum]|uniref:Protein kinase domain-containing protein n=1 Tax=Dorcoceras hygrometricum TaxID=472368 RepID=A0A2Z7BS79_9LAMI|nr:hypothetical protein F511_20220 [Dorcoceras hygrometricum]